MNSDELWAKDNGESLLSHSLSTANMSLKILDNLPISDELKASLRTDLKYIAVLHDAGKSASGFQNTLRNKGRWGHRHEILSTAIIHQIYPQLKPEFLFAVLTHHRSIPSNMLTESEKCLPEAEMPSWDEIETKPEWLQMVMELEQNQNKLGTYLQDALNSCNSAIGTPLKISGLNSLGVPEFWVSRDYQKKKVTPEDRVKASMLRGILCSSDHLSSAGEKNVPVLPSMSKFKYEIISTEFRGANPRNFQERCGAHRGDCILKAPTGSGKTGANLLWAVNNQAKNGRMFYVLPHTASINAMYLRLNNIFSKKMPAVGVLHHKNTEFLYSLMEDDSEEDREANARRLAGLVREIYHPIRVCTPHQILRISLQGKGWESGFLEFQNGCFIFDEIHAFEPKLVGLTLATAKWLKSLGAKILFSSATIPNFLKDILQTELNMPQTSYIHPDGLHPTDREIIGQFRHRIKFSTGSLLDNLDFILTKIKDTNKSVLIICNHVATAQAVMKKFGDSRISATLFHARFNGEDRFDIEKKVMSKTPPKILIATQVVEVSLDLNYDMGFIEPAPADALIQRLGRINRDGKKDPAEVTIFEEPSAGHLYDEKVTNDTIEYLKETVCRNQLISEEDLAGIVDRVYSGGYTGRSRKDYEAGLTHPIISKFEESILAGSYRDWVEATIEGSDGQVEVLPDSLQGVYQGYKNNKEYLLANRLLVPITVRQKFKQIKHNELYYDKSLHEWVTYLPYNKTYGLDLSAKIDVFL